ncbi:unknown [Salmonella phage FelixO1]|uniref:Uncharacterized protein n=1 Tax=Salmonella phage Felix O1 (isolate Felix O1-VT1) TaxID=1283336 RepID=Q6KGD5_BPFO1|nr:unknown [Salmonella phage FelixO1]
MSISRELQILCMANLCSIMSKLYTYLLSILCRLFCVSVTFTVYLFLVLSRNFKESLLFSVTLILFTDVLRLCCVLFKHHLAIFFTVGCDNFVTYSNA